MNSISLSGGIPCKSSGKTSGYSQTTGISLTLRPVIAYKSARTEIFLPGQIKGNGYIIW
jgi:hypothetical protein